MANRDTTRYVLTAYNRRSETSYTFGPLGESAMKLFIERLWAADNWDFDEGGIRILNSAIDAFTGQAMSGYWEFDD